MNEELENVYRIHESFMEELEKKLKRIQKKCIKHGNDFVYEVVGDEIIDVNTDKDSEPNYQKFFLVKAEGKAIVEDWEFIATLETTGEDNVIRRYNTEVELPLRFRKSENICEHCNTKRMRKDLYVVRNTNTNDFKQIGRQCLKEYTKGLSAENVASLMEWKDFLSENDYKEGVFGNYSSCKSYIEVNNILVIAVLCTKHFGFRKSGYDNATVDRVRDLYYDFNTTTKRWLTKENIIIDKEDLYDEAIEKHVEDIKEYFLSCEDDTEFIHNVKAILKSGYCTGKQFGILSCLPYCYDKAMNKTKADEERKQKIEEAQQNDVLSSYYGEVGKRYTVNDMSFEHITSFDTMYGTMNIYKMIDNENHVFIWKSATFQEDGRYNVTFTVKNHSEYNGVLQTETSRCKLVRVDE